MNWTSLLFSPSGRINRAKYWLGFAVSYAVFLVFYVPVIVSVAPSQDGGAPAQMTPTQGLMLVLVGILGLLVTYIGIILGIKRFHDRDKSGWWVLIGLVPIIGGLWYLIECGFLRGTYGRNRFGPDPLAPNEDIVQVFGAPERTPIR